MMAGGGYVLLHRLFFGAPKKQSYGTPRFVFVQTVETVTCCYASLAAATPIQIYFKGVLLTLVLVETAASKS